MVALTVYQKKVLTARRTVRAAPRHRSTNPRPTGTSRFIASATATPIASRARPPQRGRPAGHASCAKRRRAVIFNTIGGDDGIAMGPFRQLYSLPSRELIADGVETMPRALCDGMVCIPNCDKIVPGCHGRHARQHPDVFCHGGRWRRALPSRKPRMRTRSYLQPASGQFGFDFGFQRRRRTSAGKIRTHLKSRANRLVRPAVVFRMFTR